MSKHMKDMNAEELEELIKQKEHEVAKLNYERPGSPEARWAAGELKDAKELLADKRKRPNSQQEPTF